MAAVAVFGIIWTIGAAGMGAPGVFPLFGVVFTVLAGTRAVYEFKNATGKNRYSEYDIVDGSEEPDPLNERFRPSDDWDGQEQTDPGTDAQRFLFCPYCGKKLDEGDKYCGQCGKKVR